MSWLRDEEDQEVDDYYKEQDRGFSILPRRGVRPGQYGFKAMCIYLAIFISLIGMYYIYQAITGPRYMVVPYIIIGAVLLTLGALVPYWGFREDARVRAEVLAKKRWQQEKHNMLRESLKEQRINPYDDRISRSLHEESAKQRRIDSTEKNGPRPLGVTRWSGWQETSEQESVTDKKKDDDLIP